MNNVLFTALTSSGEAFGIAFPLRPQTPPVEAVSEMMTSLLETLSRHAEAHANVSDEDVWQALARASATRSARLDEAGWPGSADTDVSDAWKGLVR